jgi:hypothetical protein
MFGFRFKRKYRKYMDMKKTGKTLYEIYLAAKADGLDFYPCLNVLESVCGLSSTKAKEVIICYEKYSVMKEAGKMPREIYHTAKTDGLNSVQRVEILWYVCGLSLEKAKEVMICSDTGAKSLSEYQEKQILPALKEVFEQEERDSTQNGDVPPKK